MRASEGTEEKLGERAETNIWVRDRKHNTLNCSGSHLTLCNEKKRSSIRVAYKLHLR